VALECFTDAVFYLSYARQFEELVLRYGFPYYATRFGGILPDALSGRWLGEIAGIWGLRWVLSAMVSIGLYQLFRKRYGLLAGLIASMLWSLNPAALRLICTTYVDSTSVPLLILGCCLWSLRAGGNLGAVLTGIVFAMAASAHLYAAFALVLLIPFLLGARLDGRKGDLLESSMWVMSGFLVTFAVASIWYWMKWGMPAILSPTLEVMRDITAGKGACWKLPLSVALDHTPAWFAPIVLIPASIVIAYKGSTLAKGACASLILSSGFFWGGDLLGNAFVLSLPFYYSFLLPVTILSAAIIAAESFSIMDWESSKTVLFIVMASGLFLITLLASRCMLSLHLEWIVILAGSGSMFVLRESIRVRVLLAVLVASILGAAVIVAGTWSFARLMQGYGTRDLEIIELATAMRSELPKASDDPKAMRFWCDDSEGTLGGRERRMIDSFWLNTFGMLRGNNDQIVEFLKMTPEDAKVIAQSGVDRIVVLDQEGNQVQNALQAMSDLKLPFHLLKRVSLHAGSSPAAEIQIAILERDAGSPSLSNQQIDLQQSQPLNGGKVTISEAGVFFTSTPKKWEEFASLPIGSISDHEELIMKCRIMSGRIRFALKNEKGQLFQIMDRWAIDGDQEIQLRLPKGINSGYLTLANLYPNGVRSTILLKSVSKSQNGPE
jgi:hypothetical protein